MSTALVVVHPFADYASGDRITDSDQVQKVLASNPAAVIRISVEDAPEVAPTNAKE